VNLQFSRRLRWNKTHREVMSTKWFGYPSSSVRELAEWVVVLIFRDEPSNVSSGQN